MTSLSMTDRVYEMLKADIITCVLEPGQQIVQSQLVEKYQQAYPGSEAAQRLVRKLIPVPRSLHREPCDLSDVHEIYDFG